jgi:uncharacterized cupredoxin-like copper-binding protein
MKWLFSFSCAFIIITAAHAQSTAEHEMVMKPVRLLFHGMQKSDSAEVRKAFSNIVTMASVETDKNGNTIVKHESVNDFLKAIGTPHAETYNEMIWDEKILIDGNFAQVWTSYAFYLGKKFNHCGVDAFHLAKNASGEWKIFHLADTRRKVGCNIPEKISKQFE